MENIQLFGPFPLNSVSIGALSGDGPGVYILDRNASGDTFYVHYVGRSDSTLKGRLLFWTQNGSYRRFKYAFYTTSKDAFMGECNLYHDYPGSDNENHPQRPEDENWKCPRCNIFD